MFKRRRPIPEDPSVAVIEEMLSLATSRATSVIALGDGKPVVDRAIWFCACMTEDDADAPTWLIVDRADGGLGWCRMPNGLDVDDMADAIHVDGDHVHPEQVLAWLRGTVLDGIDWIARGRSDITLSEDVGRRIRASLVS